MSDYDPSHFELFKVAVEDPPSTGSALSQNHPNVVRQDDGSYLCSDCGAESFNLSFLDKIACSNGLESVVRSIEEPTVRMGDVWIEGQNTWVRGRREGDEPVWYDGLSSHFLSIRAKNSTTDIAPGYNPEVKTVTIRGQINVVSERSAESETSKRMREYLFRQMATYAKTYQNEIQMYRISPYRTERNGFDPSTHAENVALKFEVRPKP